MLHAKLLAEFIGTFFLVFIIGMIAFDPNFPPGMAPYAIAGVLAAMIYALGHVSGGHFNPAVTLVLTISGSSPRSHAGPYMVVQIFAAIVAGLISLWISSQIQGAAIEVSPMELDILPTMFFEALFTFAMVLVILNVATAKAIEGNQFFGLAIGLVILVGVFVAGPVSGGAFNPAVTIALGVTGLADWSDVWMHFTGQLAGACLATAAFTVMSSSAAEAD